MTGGWIDDGAGVFRDDVADFDQWETDLSDGERLAWLALLIADADGREE